VVNAPAFAEKQYLRTLVLNTGYLAERVRQMPVSDQIEVPSFGHGSRVLHFLKAS